MQPSQTPLSITLDAKRCPSGTRIICVCVDPDGVSSSTPMNNNNNLPFSFLLFSWTFLSRQLGYYSSSCLEKNEKTTKKSYYYYPKFFFGQCRYLYGGAFLLWLLSAQNKETFLVVCVCGCTAKKKETFRRPLLIIKFQLLFYLFFFLLNIFFYFSGFSWATKSVDKHSVGYTALPASSTERKMQKNIRTTCESAIG